MKKKNLIYLIIALIFTLGQIGLSISVVAQPAGNVNKINVISPKEIQLVGDNLQPQDKIITLTGSNNSTLKAKYDTQTKNFMISKGSLTPGINYKVSADWTNIPDNQSELAIPLVTNIKQLSPNQIQITYDRDVDLQTATNPSSYWIQSTEDKPTGIATLGKNDKINANNALNPNKVNIKPVQGSKKEFILTFKDNISPKMQYKIIALYVTTPGSTGYIGDNIGASSNNTFIGQ